MAFNLQADTNRRRRSLRDWIIYQGEWERPEVWGNGVTMQAPICGPFGEIILMAVQATFEGGTGRPFLDEHNKPTGQYGYPSRWAGILQTCNPALNPTQMLAGKESKGRSAPLYHEPIRVSGIPGSAWPKLRASSGLDVVLLQKQSLSVACGSAGVGVSIEMSGHPPGLQAFAPHEVTFIASSRNPLEAEVSIQWLDGGAVIISDIRNPRFPRFGKWRQIEHWQNGHEPLTVAEGEFYPFIWQGKPRLHIVACRSQPAPSCLQPGATALSQLTIDTILVDAWLQHVIRYGSINRVAVTSEGDGDVNGFDQLSMDLRAVIHVAGRMSTPAIEVIPHGMDGAKTLAELCRDRLQSHLAMIDGDLRVRGVATGVQSGIAIELEREGVEDYARSQMQIQRPTDTAIIELLCACYNWQALNGHIDPALLGMSTVELIPEETPVIDYPLHLSPAERRTIAETKKDIDPVGAHMLLEGMDPSDPDARSLAFDQLATITQQRVALIKLGYGLKPETIWMRPPVSEADEAVTHIPPSDVADTAAKGLRMQKEFRARWGGLQASELLRRAKSLQQQTPMMVGEIRALSVWLDANAQAPANGSAGEGTWGDDADPSGEYIRYLSQGGNEAQVWCASILTETPVPVNVPLQPTQNPQVP